MRSQHPFVKVTGALAVLLGAVATAGAGEIVTRVPQGHVYGPDSQRAPTINSYQYRVDSQTDVFEAEVYRNQHEHAVIDGELERLIEHDLTGGTNFEPRY